MQFTHNCFVVIIMNNTFSVGCYGQVYCKFRNLSMDFKHPSRPGVFRLVKEFSKEGPLILEYDMQKQTHFKIEIVPFDTGSFQGQFRMAYFNTADKPTYEPEDLMPWSIKSFVTPHYLEYDDSDDCTDGWILRDEDGRDIIKIQSVKTEDFLNSLKN